MWVLQFPLEIIFHIISFIDSKSILSSAALCKEWCYFLQSREKDIWKLLCLTHWPHMRSAIQIIEESSKHEVSFKKYCTRKEAWQAAACQMVMIPTVAWKVEGLVVEQQGTSEGTSVRSGDPWECMPIICREKWGVFYYEVEVLEGGKNCHFGIGIGDSYTPQATIPGWNRGGDTLGYHADNGLKYYKVGEGKEYAQPYQTGDTVGCGYDVETSSVFFTLNGICLGVAFTNIPYYSYFPMIGSLEAVILKCNFGSSPFKFDIDAFYFHHGNTTFRKKRKAK